MLVQSIHPAVFFDKDGVLHEKIPNNVNPSLMSLTQGAGEALRQLQSAGYWLFVISNQPGVAKGLFKEEALLAVRRRLNEMLGSEGVTLNGFYYCPHHPEGRIKQYSMECFCRKPSPGMLFRAAREHNLDLSNSWFIGDILNDIECGRRANCGTILVENGNEKDWHDGAMRRPHFTVSNMLEAAQIVLENSQTILPAELPKNSNSLARNRSLF